MLSLDSSPGSDRGPQCLFTTHSCPVPICLETWRVLGVADRTSAEDVLANLLQPEGTRGDPGGLCFVLKTRAEAQRGGADCARHSAQRPQSPPTEASLYPALCPGANGPDPSTGSWSSASRGCSPLTLAAPCYLVAHNLPPVHTPSDSIPLSTPSPAPATD